MCLFHHWFFVFFFWLLLLISSQLRRWKSFASFRSERLFLFSVVKSKPKQRQQGKCEWPSCVLVLVWNLIGQESGANFQDQSKSEVKRERTILRENYTFKTMCSWWWSTTSQNSTTVSLFFFFFFYNGFLLFFLFSWSLSTPHSFTWWRSRHRGRWRQWMWQTTKRWLVSFPKQDRNTNADYVSTDWYKVWYNMARLVRRSSSDGGRRNSCKNCLLSKASKL